MAEQIEEQINLDITDDDKLWAALAYVFSPLIPVILLFMEDKKDRPFIKAHNIQALVWGIVIYVISFILTFVVIGPCLGLAGWGLAIYWGVKADQGEQVTIPVITDFVKNQGWA